MLYGRREEEYVQTEYSLVKKVKKAKKIKKFTLWLCIVLLCFSIFFISFYVSYTSFLKNKNPNISEYYEIIDSSNKVQNEVISDEISMEEVVVKEKHTTIPKANENGVTLVKDIYFSEEKQVYLTFDDGPSKDITPQILDILAEEEVKATFFVVGSRVELHPEIIQREFEEGHYIANHGYTHTYSKIYRSKDYVFEEYIKCENAIRNALNNQEYSCFLFRFPGGSSGGKYSKVKASAKELFTSYGIATTNWNCLTSDAAGSKTKDECYSEFINTKGTQNSLVILMHDANDKTQTVEALSDIIHYLKEENYTFKNFYEIFK